MICPFCHVNAGPSLAIRDIAICSACGGSVHVADDGKTRALRYADIADFELDELAQLRRMRASIARPERQG